MQLNGQGEKILVVDDEPQIRRFIKAGLAAHNYEVVEAVDGRDAIKQFTTANPDLVILDLGLPDKEGDDVLKEIRSFSEVPVIILSVRSDESDKVKSLGTGANDYMTKPFGMSELLARLKVRLKTEGAPIEDEPAVSVGAFSVDLSRRIVTKGGLPIQLSKKEYAILRQLVLNIGKVVSHQFLLEKVWGQAYGDQMQYLRVYIGHLRSKLEDDPSDPKYILTEQGVGYRLVDSAFPLGDLE